MASPNLTIGVNLSKLRRQLEAISRHSAALAAELAEIEKEGEVESELQRQPFSPEPYRIVPC